VVNVSKYSSTMEHMGCGKARGGETSSENDLQMDSPHLLVANINQLVLVGYPPMVNVG
jgi:hypothetical protein